MKIYIFQLRFKEIECSQSQCHTKHLLRAICRENTGSNLTERIVLSLSLSLLASPSSSSPSLLFPLALSPPLHLPLAFPLSPSPSKIGYIQFLRMGAKKYKFSILLCAVSLRISKQCKNLSVCTKENKCKRIQCKSSDICHLESNLPSRQRVEWVVRYIEISRNI